MKTVKVKGTGIQVNGNSYFKNDVFEVTEENYEPIKELVEVLKEDKTTEERVIAIKIENKELDLQEVESYLYNCLEHFGEIPEDNDGSDKNVGGTEETKTENDGEDEELKELKAKAQELGINVTHNMKKETIIKKIEEAEAAKKAKEGQGQNPEGE